MPNPFQFITDLIDPPSNRKIRQQTIENLNTFGNNWEWEKAPITEFSNRQYIAVKYFCHTDTARVPTYARDLDAGADLYADRDLEIAIGRPGLVSTGLSIVIPAGFEMQIRPRRGTALANGITVLNSPGTIAAGYKGIISVLLYNAGTKTYRVSIGDRIAKAVFAPVARAEFRQLSPTEFQDIDSDRSVGGFGSARGYQSITHR